MLDHRLRLYLGQSLIQTSGPIHNPYGGRFDWMNAPPTIPAYPDYFAQPADSVAWPNRRHIFKPAAPPAGEGV